MKKIILLTALCFVLSSCSSEVEDEKQELPEVNDFNCSYEQIVKLKTKELQQEFSSLCLRRNPPGESTTNKSWGASDF